MKQTMRNHQYLFNQLRSLTTRRLRLWPDAKRAAVPVSLLAVLLLIVGATGRRLFSTSASSAFFFQQGITTLGVPYTQSFNTLPASGSATWTNNSTIPGWFHARTGTGTTIVANDGSSNAGNLYSYGTGTATDRALGSLGSGNVAIGNLFWGVRLQNNSGATITSLDVSYTGEQWRNSAAAAQTITFSYLVGSPTVTGSLAEFQAAGVAVPSLNFTSPITGGTAGALNGNLAANRVTLTFSITGLSIPNGTEVMLRWSDPDHTGADHGLAIDDFSVTPQGATAAQPNLTITDVSQAEGSGGTTTFTFNVNLNAPAGPSGVTFDIATANGTAQDDNPATEDNDYVAQSLTGQTIPMGSTSYTFTVTVNGDTTAEPNETFFVNVTNITGATGGDTQGQGTIVNDDVSLTPIHDIQGNGTASPIIGATVTTTGIVTLLRTGSNAGGGTANGFFLQTPDANVDADPNTSQGIFIFTNALPAYTSLGTPVAVGDELNVTGTVVEFNGLTEINNITNLSVIDTGNPLPTAVTVTATLLDPTALPTQPQLEKYEGMRLSAAALLSVAPNDDFLDIETVLASVPRQQVFREPGIPISDPVPPDPTSGTVDCCIPRWDENPERLKLDTNGRAGAPNNAYTSNVTFTNVTGPLDFAFDEYRLIPDAALTASPNMSAIAVPVPLADEFTVAGFNIENFNNSATQRQKAALAIRDVMRLPHIIGVAEIFDLADLQALATEINTIAPGANYTAHLVEADGTSEDNDQDVGYLVDTARVTVTSVTQRNATETFINPNTKMPELLNDRPPLVLDANIQPAGANVRVLVVVNHLRSFIDIELVAGEGPRVRAKRKAQAESLAALLQELQTNNPTTPVISVGDYNAFQFSSGYDDSIAVIKGNPTPDDQIVVDQSPDLVNPNFRNLVDELPASEKYTFIFEGTPQVLDHVLVSETAFARYRRLAVARHNADFPEVPAAAFASNNTRPERNSDHDPLVAYFQIFACTATCPANKTVANDTGQCGANVTYDAPAIVTGDCGGAVTCNPPSGSFFGIGTTTVTCSAQAGTACTFTVTVNDNDNPAIVCPANQVAVTNSNAPSTPVSVTWPAPTVSDNCTGATSSCMPPSGSNFPLGTTTVTCKATDAADNMSATCSFTVTVRQPRSAIKDLIARVQTYVPPLTQAQANGLKGHLELANTRVEQGQLAQACTHMGNFINQVTTLTPPLAAAQNQVLISYANKIRNALGCAGGPFPTFRAETVGLYLAEPGEFKLKNRLVSGQAELSQSGGAPNDQPIAGDWDGDGVDTVGVYRQGVFYLRHTGGWAAAPDEAETRLNKRAETIVAFGQAGDVPVVGDWNGDGIDTIGVFRNGVFLLRNSNTAGEPELVINLGQAGDLPLAGDWDGDGTVTVGIYRWTSGLFQLRQGWSDGAAEVLVLWGGVDYLPLVGDWDGDGITTVGLYSQSGEFLLRNTNTAGPAEIVLTLGLAGGLPLAGDWDGLP